jgi:hypothetical protein
MRRLRGVLGRDHPSKEAPCTHGVRSWSPVSRSLRAIGVATRRSRAAPVPRGGSRSRRGPRPREAFLRHDGGVLLCTQRTEPLDRRPGSPAPRPRHPARAARQLHHPRANSEIIEAVHARRAPMIQSARRCGSDRRCRAALLITLSATPAGIAPGRACRRNQPRNAVFSLSGTGGETRRCGFRGHPAAAGGDRLGRRERSRPAHCDRRRHRRRVHPTCSARSPKRRATASSASRAAIAQ